MRIIRYSALCSILLSSAVACSDNTEISTMLDSITEMTTMTADQTGIREISPSVMHAMSVVDRKLFVPKELASYAYVNQALPIRSNQTISQPYIVALMTHLLLLRQGQKVLEIGTGSGYQAAVLAKLVDQVYTIEIIPALAAEATKRLETLGFENIEVKQGDGWFGWEEHAPFDGIIVTAQAPSIPDRLVDQLKVGGRMVIPVGVNPDVQTLEVVQKTNHDQIERTKILSVVFVPMTGEAERISD